MAGILDSKSRVLDVILTQLGREQMAKGEFEISFVTFSDNGVEYKDDGSGVLKSSQDDLFFEAFSKPQDEIVPEINNVGDFTLLSNISPTLTVDKGVLYESTENGFQQVDAFENISKFSDVTTTRWNDLKLLKSRSSVTPPRIEPEISGARELKVPKGTTVEISSLPPVVVDERFSGNINTLFLPPIVHSANGTVTMRAYNNYTRPFNQETMLDKIKKESSGKIPLEIASDTKNGTDMYNFIIQAFVGINQSVKKYLVVDGGEFVDGDGNPTMKVFHLGFVFKDNYPGSDTAISKFSRGFSVVFHNGDL